jgi:ATP-dependent Clp protease protease subunit
MNNTKDFYLYSHDRGISSMMLDSYSSFMSGYINPTILEERKLNVAQLDIFSRLQADRIIFLGVPINDDVANIIQAQLLYLSSNDDKADISLYINSPGGHVHSGLGIYDTMQIINPKVATICTGMAASMAAVLLCAGEPGKRSILPHSRTMIHQPLGGAEGQASDILIAAEQMRQTKEELLRIIADHTGQYYDKVVEDCDRDYWMTAQESVDYGIVDSIMVKKK